MKLKLCTLSVLLLTSICEARMVASRFECLAQPCFFNLVNECADALVARHRRFEVAQRRCVRQLVKRCRRNGTGAVACAPSDPGPRPTDSYPTTTTAPSPTTTTSTTYPSYPTTTLSYPSTTSTTVPSYMTTTMS